VVCLKQPNNKKVFRKGFEMFKKLVIPMLLIAYGLILTFTQGCASKEAIVKTGSFKATFIAEKGKTLTGSVDLDLIKEAGSGSTDIGIQGAETANVEGTYYEKRVDRKVSTSCTWQSWYFVDANGKQQHRTYLSFYDGSSAIGDLFDTENEVPIIQDMMDEETYYGPTVESSP